ncbi:hypothetical protein [Streptomyces sp. ODS28]|uniref:hypothetical protein n=1 Tax=Streptomyces sp. ODS28 TaxID=3136688 RepID=UPI0031E50BAE
MKLDALRHGDFSKLNTAVEKWTDLVTDLERLAKDAREELSGKAKKASWKGVNATVTRQFIDKTAGEFDDAVTQATSLRNILKDTHDELVHYKGKLNDRIEAGKKDNLYVVDNRNGTYTVEQRNLVQPPAAQPPPGTPPLVLTPEQTAMRNDIDQILRDAGNSDRSAAEALRAYVESSPVGFADGAYADRNAAADAMRDGRRAADLAKKGDDMSPQEFDELNRLLKDKNKDDLFAEKFATDLGGRKTLETWADLMEPTDNPDLAQARKDQFGELQKNLGMTLANATQSDSPAMTRWQSDVIQAGGDQIRTRASAPYGFQVMSSLMRYGDYDDRFLGAYGKELVATEKKMTHNGDVSHNAWLRMGQGMPTDLNPAGKDDGQDPVSGFMSGLSRSPDAATDFFNDSFVTKDEDHGFEDGDGNKRALSNFDYFFKERDWPESRDIDGNTVTGHEDMARALEAGATGHPTGERATADSPPHTPGQAKLMGDVVHAVSEKPELLKDHMSMGDNFGRMGAEYMPEFYQAMRNDDTKLGGTSSDTDALFPVVGAKADISPTDATAFMATVSQDPNGGYAELVGGHKRYAADLIDHHLNPEVQAKLPEDERFKGNAEDMIRAVSRTSGEMAGTTAIGLQEATLGPAAEDAQKFKDSVDTWRSGAVGALGIGVGVGTSFIATPAGGAAVAGVINGAGLLAGAELSQDALDQNADHEKMRAAGDIWSNAQSVDANASRTNMQRLADAYDLPQEDRFDSWAVDSSKDGFNDAQANVARRAPEIESASKF